MRQRERERLNEKAARMVMEWTKSESGVWQMIDPETQSSEFAGYSWSWELRRIDSIFDPCANISHAWMLVEQLQLPPDVPLKLAIFDRLMRTGRDSSVSLWALGHSEIAARLTKAAITTVMEYHQRKLGYRPNEKEISPRSDILQP